MVNQVRGATTELVESFSTQIAQGGSTIIGEWLKARHEEVFALSESNLVKGLNWNLMRDTVTAQAEGRSDVYDSFIMVNGKGEFWSTDGAQGNVADRDYFKAILEGGQDRVITDPLITHVDAARQRAAAVLADTGPQATVSLRLPVLAATGLIQPGKFVRYLDGAVTRVGIVRGTALDWQRPTLRQTLTVETHGTD